MTPVLFAISQFERDLTVQRAIEGLKAAREKVGGRPEWMLRRWEKAIKLYHAQMHSIKDCDFTGVSQYLIQGVWGSPSVLRRENVSYVEEYE